MKIQYVGLAVLGMAMMQNSAMAEMIAGTISGIDPQAKTMTVVRNDTQNPVKLSVQDQTQLLGLQPGSSVVVDANKKFFGGWEVESVTMSDAAEAGNSAGNEASMNAGSPSPIGNDANMNQATRSFDSPNAQAGNPNPQAANTDLNANPTADSTY